ncbi:Vomeronasal type-1 receptor 4 [Galemys pyrenaicus]|uniref:Vomeronasal type-1 receptor 4 n=1 Tax=Galemys pyrenaicus TaxID=202257 RepID=A0A8J6DW64_GALPY|nr:Vomeronasal type-1 receptor 4 [Galemys pyrenaicus]
MGSRGLRRPGAGALTWVFLLQEVVGTLANAVLFLHHVPVLCGPRKTPPSTVLPHLAVANVLVLLCIGTPHLLAAWVSRTPLSSLGCKVVIFLQRTARGTTLCSTCLLSTSQRLTLSPGRLGWTVLRGGLPRVLGPSCCTCWLLSALISVYIPFFVTGPGSPSNVSTPQGRWFCSSSGVSHAGVILYFVPDAIFLSLMGWASVSMALLLRRHQHRVRHLHTPRPGQGCTPETRATRTVLRLTVTFVGFYLLNYGFVFCMDVVFESHLWVMQRPALGPARAGVLTWVFLLLMGVGTLANAVLFLHHVPVLCGPSTVLPHLAVANVFVLLCIGTPHLLAAWVSRTPLSSLGCKLVNFLQRTAWGTTLCSTCLLSTSQRLTLSPGRLGWTVLRGGLPRVLGPSCCTCWLLSALINVPVPISVAGPGSPSNVSAPQGRWFCSDLDPRPAIVILWLVPDAIFLSLMGWASVSMALLLRRHQHRVRHLHTSRPGRGSPPETTATRAVLRLTVTFVGFYLLNSTVTFYMTAFVDMRLWGVQTVSGAGDVMSGCPAAASPPVLACLRWGPCRCSVQTPLGVAGAGPPLPGPSCSWNELELRPPQGEAHCWEQAGGELGPAPGALKAPEPGPGASCCAPVQPANARQRPPAWCRETEDVAPAAVPGVMTVTSDGPSSQGGGRDPITAAPQRPCTLQQRQVSMEGRTLGCCFVQGPPSLSAL